MSTYTIDTERNSYFNGRDAVLHKNCERVAKIALKDNRPAIYVKCYSYGTDATKAMRDDLGEARLAEIVEGLQRDFWWHLADEDVQRDGNYDEVHSAGRSGGWCVPIAARDRDWHWWEEVTIDAPIPEHESADELSAADARKLWFFEAAETITAEVEYLRTEGFDEAVREAYAELESAREAALVRGEN